MGFRPVLRTVEFVMSRNDIFDGLFSIRKLFANDLEIYRSLMYSPIEFNQLQKILDGFIVW